MNKNNPLSFCVLITRPAPHGKNLSKLLRQHHYRTVWLPTLTITPWHDITSTQQVFSSLENRQWVMFISPQAVFHAQPFLPTLWPKQVKVVAMGKGTERALQQMGISVDLMPQAEFTSEALLNAPELQHVDGQSILIVKGANGRTTLTETLEERGAQVDHAIVYQRTLPEENIASQEQQLNDYLQKSKMVVVSFVTSAESVLNLQKLIHKEIWQKLLNLPIIVPSTRVAALASKLGFHRTWVCNALDDQTILQCLSEICQHVTDQKGPHHDRST